MVTCVHELNKTGMTTSLPSINGDNEDSSILCCGFEWDHWGVHLGRWNWISHKMYHYRVHLSSQGGREVIAVQDMDFWWLLMTFETCFGRRIDGPDKSYDKSSAKYMCWINHKLWFGWQWAHRVLISWHTFVQVPSRVASRCVTWSKRIVSGRKPLHLEDAR